MTRNKVGSSFGDMVAFNWNKGESQFRDLSGIREKYQGTDDVDLALELFDYGTDHESALYAYRQKLQQQYANGEIDLATAAKKIERAADPEFINGAYEDLDRRHISVGRDLARALLPETWEDDKAFTAISGTGDTLWTLFADPTLVGQAAYRAAQISKWGLESANSTKIYHMLGLDDPVTGLPAPKKYTGVMGNSRREGIEDLLMRGEEWRNARAAGDEDGAAAIYESARMAHKDMISLWGEMNGLRPAITQAERDLAAKEGHRFVDGLGVEYPYGAIKTDPITNVEQFADWATGPWGLMRLANGLPAHEVMMMPGRMGYWAEKRANRAMVRTLTGSTRAREAGAELLDFSDENIDKITGTLREDELRRIAEARGQQLFDQATSGNPVKRLPLKFDAMMRRVSTLIPESRTVDLASSADAKIIRQWGRIFLPKWEAARMASLWESGSPATRRTLLKGLMLQTFEAAGLTRSAAGREFVDKWINDIDQLDKRRYGFGQSDVVTDGYSGARRAGLYPSQIETSVTLPAWSELRQIAAKAAVMGYDPHLASLGLNVASLKTLAKGKLGLTALRYWLFNSTSIDRAFGLIRMGWIVNPANMTRNLGDEYLNLAITGNLHRLRRGRQTMRDADLNHNFELGRKFVSITNARIPRAMRMNVRNVSDAMRAIHEGKLRSMGTELSDQRVAYAEELNDEMIVAEIADALGGRTVDNVDESVGLGHAYAQEAHKRGVPMERFEYKGHKLIDRDGAAGLGALSNNYGQRFLAPRMLPKVKPEYRDEILEWANNKEWDEWERTLVEYEAAGKKIPKSLAEPKQYEQVSVDMARRWHEATGLDSPFVFRNAEDSPANGVLAYIMWHHAIDNPEFMDSLDDDSKWLLEQFYPNAHLQGDIPGGALSLDEFKDSGKTLYHGTGRKFDQFQASRDFSNTGRGVNEGVYFTADPKVANTFAWVHKGIEEAPDNFFDSVDEGLAYPGVTPELVERLRQARRVAQDIRDGKTVYSAEAKPAAAAPEQAPADWLPPKQGEMRARISEIRKLKGDERIAAQRQLVEDMRAEWARGGIEFLNAPESGTNSRWIDNLSNDFNDYLRFDNMMDNQHLGALQKLKNKADDAAKAAGVVKDSADDTTSLKWTQGTAKLASEQGSKKIPLKDQPEKRLSALKIINAQQGNRIDLDDPKVQAIINDTSRKSPDEFSRFVHNSWVSWNVNAKREAFLATKGKAPGAPAPAAAAAEPITRQEAMAAERAAEADVMKAMLRARIERGAKAKVDYDSVNVKTNKRTQIKATIDSPEQLDELDPVVFNEPEFWTLVKKGWEPRVIEAKVYGRTIDLRDPKKFPDDLRAALKEEKRWDPAQLGGSATYAHERSRALIEWMRANGYSKAHLLDSPESGGESYLVLPEMIEHNRDVVGEYAQKLADHVAANPPTVDDLAEHLRDPRFARMRRELEHYNVDEAGNRISPDDAEALDKALVRMIPKYIEDITHAVTGRNGKLNPELTGMLLRGEVPDQYELKAFGQDALPPMAIAAQYGTPAEGVPWLLEGMTAKVTRAYDLMVTKPIRAILRAPLYTDMYTTARFRTQEMADMLVEKHGWNPEVANELAMATARKQAMIETVKYVDNPRVASQFSQMSRNWWSFFRAQEDWLRRYGRAIKADPVAIRKAQLGIMGAEEVGILDRDEDGNLLVTYPFTGAAVEGFLHVAQYIGWLDDSVLIPNVPDLRTRLTFMSPSLNNPLQYSATPMVSLPMRFITALAPGGELMDAEIDRAINGELGAGRRWYEQFFPPAVMRLAQLSDDDWNTGSKVGSAMATAMQFMTLNGTIEQYSDTKEDRARFLEDLQTMTKNILVVRQVFAFGLPGAPEMPQVAEDEFGMSSKAYQEAGIMTLKEEFRQMASSMGYGPALRLWSELYPNALAFEYGSKSETAAPGANAPITIDAASFVSKNREFFKGKYQSIAPYFMPEESGEFDQIAWNSMLRSEVRQYKDLDDFFIDLVTADGINEYYKKQDAHEAAVKDARMRKDRDAVSKLNADWDAEKKRLHTVYPTLDDWMDQGTIRARARQDRIERLMDLVADPNAPAAIQPQIPGMVQMLKVYKGYMSAHDSLGTSRSASATAARQDLNNDYHDAMQQIIKEYPSLEDAYNGIFRLMVEQE
jgi:hypothetical protein